ncbi:hypothetical protein ACRALDRAFT_1028690 [Sodiomyces alcalophilus JCM 7366]|uniref:uncharacterized protein n=1 Tax=Sodiomyces alcalophilus JCM 7366 TaxID=591952 RepID=UPI0039B50149
MPFSPTAFGPDAEPLIHDVSGSKWVPFLEHECSFNPDIFDQVMMNLVRNPNLNTPWLFRADILYDSRSEAVEVEATVEPSGDGHGTHHDESHTAAVPRVAEFRDFEMERTLVRRMMPRNTRRDAPLDQTCIFLRHRSPDQPQKTRSLIVYLPHESSIEHMPFYHPKVRGVAHLHEWDADTNQGRISVHYWLFEDSPVSERLERTALMLLSVLHKHGHGRLAGYTKRVQHDVIVNQVRVQDRYLALKLKYAKDLVDTWAETTDPEKHVFEDLGIAAFLIELWSDMYGANKDKYSRFPGFVDIGCGNGLLVHILLHEGYSGWGFDARARKSWAAYGKTLSPDQPEPLQRLVLLPTLASPAIPSSTSGDDGAGMDPTLFHDGNFPKGTFIISNHADELTPWTPILATLSESPFIMIPCCSHDLGGAKFRAPPPRDKSKSKSAYSSLVDWVARIAEDCGWKVETEMLRIPSTRNCALLGRTRTTPAASVDVQHVVEKYGGTHNYFENAIRLTETETGH